MADLATLGPNGWDITNPIRKGAIVQAQSAVAASVTGTLTETTLATIAIPAGMMGVNGAIRVTTVWTVTNNANSKILGGKLAGSSFFSQTVTTTNAAQFQTSVRNRGVANQQTSFPAGIMSITSSANLTLAVDTKVEQNLILTGTLANTGDTITLEGYTVEILNP